MPLSYRIPWKLTGVGIAIVRYILTNLLMCPYSITESELEKPVSTRGAPDTTSGFQLLEAEESCYLFTCTNPGRLRH